MTFSVGFTQNFITPGLDKPVYLAGFGQNRHAESVHDDLTVRALALRSDNVTLILCAVDLICFFHPDVLEVIRRVQEEAANVQIIIAATHTHHGPDTMGLWGPDNRHSGVDPVYLSGLKDRIVATLLASIQKMAPVSLKATSVHVARRG